MSQGVNKKVLYIGLALVVPMLVLFAASFGNDPRAVPSVLEGAEAPTFELTTLDGDSVSLGGLQGKPVVINFWSTWCLPCKQEHHVLLDGARRHKDVQFLGILYSDTPDKAVRYLATAGAAYPHLIDVNGRTAIDYGVAGVPETYFIDAAGRIVHKQVGPVNGPLLEALIARMGVN